MASGGDPVCAQRARGSNPRVKESTVHLLQKAARSVAAAKRLLEAGDNDFAASRAYYAMFYVAEALLSQKGLHFRKHAAVHGGFAENFVKTSALDARYHGGCWRRSTRELQETMASSRLSPTPMLRA